MSSNITTFIATALVLFSLGQAVAESARNAAHETYDPITTATVPAQR